MSEATAKAMKSAAEAAPLSSLGMAMLFGSIIFATAALAARSWLTGDNRPFLAAFNTRSSPLDLTSFDSIYTLLHHCSIFGFILFFAYICENHPPFPHAEKSYDRDQFFFLTALVILASIYTLKRNDQPSHKTSSCMTDDPKRGKNFADKLHAIAENGDTPESSSKANSHKVGGGTASFATSVGDDSTYTTYTAATTGTFIQAADTTPANDVLNRDQTEEWKGWMQFIFLIYHYYHASEVYNAIRVMITCYVWMTGFGNFSFFYLKQDYSLIRVLQMLWRLNFLVIFLCMSQGTTYILYYICPLHTYFFFMVYFTMRIGKHLNYSKFGLRFKLFLLAIGIYLMWDVDIGLFRMIHFGFLTTKPHLGAPNGSLWEWYFRTTLDHWSTFLGMIFAANFPIVSLFYRKLEALPTHKHIIAKSSIGIALLLAFTMWLTGPFQQAKFIYNTTNPYFGFIPLVTYIYFRNLTPTFRSYSLQLLHEIGKTTLETYLMQHHIWLSSNAKTVLTLIPGSPKVNMLIVTVIYFYISRRLYRLTLFLRGMLLPDKSLQQCIQSIIAMVFMMVLFYGLAFFLNAIDYATLPCVGLVCVTGGMLLYQTVMDVTWDSLMIDGKKESDDEGDPSYYNRNDKSESEECNRRTLFRSPVAQFSPPIIGVMVIFILGLSWQGMAISGATKVGPLPSSCENYVNNGKWIPINGCNEESRGIAYRNHGVINPATCGTYSWAWRNTRSSSHCRFQRRSAEDIQKRLVFKRIAFIGDSMTRFLYHSFCRQMGMDNAGQYDATGPKHADIHNTIDDVGVDFKWAPLATDQLSVVKEVSASKVQNALNKYDLVVVGGGAWDRLHLFATDEDQESHRETLAKLAKEMESLQMLGMPVIWSTPTTINTPALNTAEKRDNMTEKDMRDMRAIYASNGIESSASFVIDGTAYTKDRVNESYDGVHFPHEVYSAGAQILANALDWLLPEEEEVEISPSDPGTMSNPFLGLMMLCTCFIGLMFFDGFLGFSYVACLFVKGILPGDLYIEAFTILHEKMKLPPIKISSSATTDGSLLSVGSTNAGSLQMTSRQMNSQISKKTSVDDELDALLGNNR